MSPGAQSRNGSRRRRTGSASHGMSANSLWAGDGVKGRSRRLPVRDAQPLRPSPAPSMMKQPCDRPSRGVASAAGRFDRGEVDADRADGEALVGASDKCTSRWCRDRRRAARSRARGTSSRIAARPRRRRGGCRHPWPGWHRPQRGATALPAPRRGWRHRAREAGRAGLDPTVASRRAISLRGNKKTAVAEHVAMVSTYATDFCDAESGGIPSGRGLSQNS